MATPRELSQSILEAMSLVQGASDDSLNINGVPEILEEMDGLADELREVLE